MKKATLSLSIDAELKQYLEDKSSDYGCSMTQLVTYALQLLQAVIDQDEEPIIRSTREISDQSIRDSL